MRPYLLPAATAVAGLISATQAVAWTSSFGNSLASTCYRHSLSSFGTVDAVNECTRAIDEEALSPIDHLATVVNRGIIRMNLHDYQPAEADFDRAIALNADYAEAYLNKAFLRLRQDQPAAAIELIDQSLARKTRVPALAFYVRGVANERMGNFRSAYGDFRKARDLAPNWSLPRKELERYSVRSPAGRPA